MKKLFPPLSRALLTAVLVAPTALLGQRLPVLSDPAAIRQALGIGTSTPRPLTTSEILAIQTAAAGQITAMIPANANDNRTVVYDPAPPWRVTATHASVTRWRWPPWPPY